MQKQLCEQTKYLKDIIDSGKMENGTTFKMGEKCYWPKRKPGEMF